MAFPGTAELRLTVLALPRCDANVSGNRAARALRRGQLRGWAWARDFPAALSARLEATSQAWRLALLPRLVELTEPA